MVEGDLTLVFKWKIMIVLARSVSYAELNPLSD